MDQRHGLKSSTSFGLAQMGVLARLGLVVPAIIVIWVVLWVLVQA